MRRKIIQISAATAATAALTILVANCGKKDSGSDDVATDTAALNISYPMGLSISIAPQNNSAMALVSNDKSDDKEDSVKVKNQEAERLVRGEADSCFPPRLEKADQPPANETCYEFDSEMIVVKSSDGSTTRSGTANGVSKTVANEACMVTYTRNQVKRITGLVDRTLGMVQMMLCQANKSGSGAPVSDGGRVDFKGIMEAAATAAGKDPARMPISTAAMTKSGDAFVTEIAMKMPSGPGQPPSDSDPVEKITLTHTPGNADNTEYSGTVAITRDRDFSGQGKQRILTISYKRAAGRVKYRLLTASVADHIAPDAIQDGVLNLNAGTNSSNQYVDAGGTVYGNQNDGMSGVLAVGFDMDPDTNAGTFSYWQNPGGSYDEEARGFIFKTDANSSTGLLSGCASSGAYSGGSIRKAIKTGTPSFAPDKSYHPIACGDGNNGAVAGCTTPDINNPTVDNADSALQYYVTAKNDGQSGQTTLRMYIPRVSNYNSSDSAARKWAFQKNENFVARQCFSQNDEGTYEIDDTEMDYQGTAGFELLPSSTDTLPKPPSLDGVR